MRRVKSVVLRTDLAYRIYLRLKFGASRLMQIPAGPLPNGTLRSEQEWKQATEQARSLRLPRHRSDEKNWDHLAAVLAILGRTSPQARILDAGAEFYSNVLPALFVCGYRDLIGINLSFTAPARRGPIRYLHGDITRTSFPGAHFDAAACLSVIEHGVPLEAYLREMYRILKPGGLLVTSTDYFPTPIDTRGQMAHGAAIKIFTRSQIQDLLRLAEEIGFERTGDIDLECAEKPVRWTQAGLAFTFIAFTLRKNSKNPPGPGRQRQPYAPAGSAGGFLRARRSEFPPVVFRLSGKPLSTRQCFAPLVALAARRIPGILKIRQAGGGRVRDCEGGEPTQCVDRAGKCETQSLGVKSWRRFAIFAGRARSSATISLTRTTSPAAAGTPICRW